ncbi:MAG TPA: hypothetical protein VK824_00105, partial [Planctomycetota bacterium]|nr:hypothetical protein [Planctomycetota bacterium]
PAYKGVTSSDLGFAKAGSNGTPALTASFTTPPDTLALAVSQAPASRPGALFLASTQALAPFKGGTLVPAPTFVFGVASNAAGALNLALPVAFSLPTGVQLYTQVWFQDAGGSFAATNALFFELITP